MKRIYSISAIAIAGVLALAQGVHADDYNDGIRLELNQQTPPSKSDLVQKRPSATTSADNLPADEQVTAQDTEETTNDAKVEKVETPAIKAAKSASSSATTAQAPAPSSVSPIYIIQQPAPSAPLTSNNASAQSAIGPKDENGPDNNVSALKQKRATMEHQTEDKLMDRLEDDRMASEKERADHIFNPAAQPSPAASGTVTAEQAVVVSPTAQATQVTAAPTPISVDDDEKAIKADDIDRLNASKKDLEETNKEEDNSQFTVGALIGAPSYPSISNVYGYYAAGAELGMQFDDGLGLIVDGVFSNFDEKNLLAFTPYGGGSLIVNVQQINVDTGLTYRILESRVSPVVGALLSYTRRNYQNRFGWAAYPYSTGTTGSDAFDGGLLAGVDVRISKHFSVGADVRYFMNITNREDYPLAYGFGLPGFATLEGSNYMFADLTLKLAL